MGRCSRWGAWILAWGLAAVAAARTPAIQFAEPVQLSLKSSVAEFDAYGRRFSLALIDNERVLHKLDPAQRQGLAGYRLLRGSLAGVPGSWVRLTQTPQGPEGAIWDGQELYAVTRYAEVESLLTTPLVAEPDQTVVYRLSDMRSALPADFCAVRTLAADPPPTALDQYKSLIAELRGGETAPAVTRQIEISLIADSAFQQAEALDPTGAMLARLNIVEGIFSEQLGLLVLATDLRLAAADADPFTSTKGATLLEQLAAYRSATAAVRARGVAHLMTGKDLDGTTAGIAYVRTVCERERAVSISQRSYGTTISAIVMAHELGHNFGAQHDGEPGTVCASTPGSGFIMSPSVSGYSTFSQCSLDTMQSVLATASCVTAAQYADVSVAAEVNALNGEGGVPFVLPFVVHSSGNETAEDTQLAVTLPASAAATVESASSSTGSCAIAGLTATCSLGPLAAGASTTVSVTARGSIATSFNAQARVSAANDKLTSNNNRLLPVTLRSGVDAQVLLRLSTGQVPVGAPFEIQADVRSLRALPLRNATLSLNLNQSVSSATLEGGICVINVSSVSCSLAEVPSGATRRVTLSAIATNPGTLYAGASISVAGDGDFANNSSTVSGWVQAARDLELTTSLVSIEQGVGSAADIPFTLRSRGSLATAEARVRFRLPTGLIVEGLDAGGAPCAVSGSEWLCEIGALAPGDARPLRLRVRADAPLTGTVLAAVSAADDEYANNDAADLPVRFDHLVDLAVAMASGGAGLEDAAIDGQVVLRSQGRQSLPGGTLTLDLHPGGELIAVRIHEGAPCEPQSATRARCVLPAMPRNGYAYVDYQARFAEPGEFSITFTGSAAGDSATDNDVLVRPVLVRPYLDAGLSGSLTLENLVAGQLREQSFTLTAGRRALDSARFLAGHAEPGLRVTAISAGTGECRVDELLGGVCDFLNLAADASVPVRVTYAARGPGLAEPQVSVSTAGDVVGTNNTLTGKVRILGATDLELRVAETLRGTSQSVLSFPAIEIVNGDQAALSPRLEIELPPAVSVVEVSAANALCSGTRLLRCEFATLEPLARVSVTLSIRVETPGQFQSLLRVSAVNDANAANDARSVSLDISGATVAASQAPPPARGGGRFEWLGLGLLAMLLLRRRLRAH